MTHLEDGKHTFDLLKYAMKVQKKHPGLLRDVKSFISITSQKQDLLDAKAVIDSATEYSKTVLPEKGSGRIDRQKGKLLRASFTEAILLYSRATDHNGTRGKFNTSALDSAMGDLHREIRKIRDKVLAHYVGKEPLQSGPWFIDEAIATIQLMDGKMAIGVSEGNHRQGWKGTILDQMTGLIDILVVSVQSQIDDLRMALAKAIGKTYDSEDCRVILLGLTKDHKGFTPGSTSEFRSYSDQ
jgi:hypothetical protein